MGRSVNYTIAVVLAVVVGLFIFLQVKDWHEESIEDIIVREKIAHQKETEKLEQEVAHLQRELSVAEGKSASQEKLADAFGT